MLTGMTSPFQPPKRYTGIIIGLVAAILLASAGILAVVFYLDKRTEVASTATPVPVISNISRPNAACTPAADRKLTASDDLTSILFIGYIDGKQTELLVGTAMGLQINGHKVEYVWYCPLRSQWQ